MNTRFFARLALRAVFAIVVGSTAVAATAGRYVDFNGDGKSDVLLYRHYPPGGIPLNAHTIWLMNGTGVLQATTYFGSPLWEIRSTLDDRTGDGKTDIFWVRRDYAPPPIYFYSAEAALWVMDGTAYAQYAFPLEMAAAGTSADFNGDGKGDVLYPGDVSGVPDIERRAQ